GWAAGHGPPGPGAVPPPMPAAGSTAWPVSVGATASASSRARQGRIAGSVTWQRSCQLRKPDAVVFQGVPQKPADSGVILVRPDFLGTSRAWQADGQLKGDMPRRPG